MDRNLKLFCSTKSHKFTQRLHEDDIIKVMEFFKAIQLPISMLK
jgi:hypothetical protein